MEIANRLTTFFFLSLIFCPQNHARPLGSYFGKPDSCLLPPKSGPCKAYFPQFYYDADKRRCAKFIYGGCAGNANRFGTITECSKTCGPNGSYLSTNSDCNLPADRGFCKAIFLRFYYDTETGQCQAFLYGGCVGNVNNYYTRSACERKCQTALPYQ